MKTYVLETLNSIDENGNPCSVLFEISEEIKNILFQFSSATRIGDKTEYTITDLKFLILDK